MLSQTSLFGSDPEREPYILILQSYKRTSSLLFPGVLTENMTSFIFLLGEKMRANSAIRNAKTKKGKI
jgi:hypothetical protein